MWPLLDGSGKTVLDGSLECRLAGLDESRMGRAVPFLSILISPVVKSKHWAAAKQDPNGSFKYLSSNAEVVTTSDSALERVLSTLLMKESKALL